jgi:dethiobiotin synthetase
VARDGERRGASDRERHRVTRLAVVGTDAGVGKTVIASALIAALRAGGVRAAPMKPVDTSDDAERLRDAAGRAFPLELVRPVAYTERVSPLVAGRRAHRPVDVGVLDGAFATLCATSDAVVIESPGGLLAPITETETCASLFKRWDADLVVVAPNRHGAVANVLLVAHAARAHGLRIRSVVLNTLTSDRADVARRTNQAVLKELLLTVPVLDFPHTPSPHDPVRLGALAREISAHSVLARPA